MTTLTITAVLAVALLYWIATKLDRLNRLLETRTETRPQPSHGDDSDELAEISEHLSGLNERMDALLVRMGVDLEAQRETRRAMGVERARQMLREGAKTIPVVQVYKQIVRCDILEAMDAVKALEQEHRSSPAKE
jgi:hypothetical protein